MTKLRRILALVLVMAMTVTMLPIFAVADDAVSEVVAVDTVETPATESVPVEDIAVEDVAVIPDTAAPEAPVIEAIETAPAEAVAVLQDVDENDVAMVIDLAAGTEIGYPTLKAAYEAAGAIDGICEITMLKDVTYVLTSGTSASSGFLNGKASTKSGYRSWNLSNYEDPDVVVNGFWLDLNGHTVTVRCTVPNTSDTNNDKYGNFASAFFLGDSVPLNVKNGTIIYKYSRTTQSGGFALIACGYGGTSASTYPIGTEEDLYTPSVTLKNVNFYRVNNSGDLAGGGTYSNAGPVITMAMLASNINIIRSNIFSTGGYGIYYNRNTLGSVAPAGITATEHNLTIQDSRIGTGTGDRAAICANGLDVGNNGGLALESSTLNVTLKGAVQFIGTDAVYRALERKVSDVMTPFETPMTVNFPQAEKLTEAATILTAPDVDSLTEISETAEIAPGYLDPISYGTLSYVDETHQHSLEYHEALEATDTTLGFNEHYVCPSCSTYYEADGKTVTDYNNVVVCLHKAKTEVAEKPATYKETGFAAHHYCSVCGSYWKADGETLTTYDALVIAMRICAHTPKAFVEEVPATYRDTGFAAHYYCSECDTYWDAEGVNETTKEALVLPINPCPHATSVHKEPVPATFVKTGMMEHWICGDCDKLFSDAELTVQVAEKDLATQLRPWTDTVGLSDAELVELGAVAKTVTVNGDTVAYDSLTEAYEAAGAYNGIMNVVLLRDVAIVPASASYGAGAINGGASMKSTYLSWDMDNTTDPELTVKGFWLDLNGHTVSVRCKNTTDNNTTYYRPAIYLLESIPLNIKNGTIVYRYGRTTQNNGIGLISCGYGSSEGNRSAIGTADELYTPSITVKNASLIRVNDGGDLANKTQKGNSGPVIVVKNLASDINIINSDIISTDSTYGAINYFKNTYATTAPAGLTAVEHNLTLQNSRVGAFDSAMAIYGTSVTAGLAVTTTLNVTLKGAVQFIGTDAILMKEDGPALNFAAAENLTEASSLISVPDVADMVPYTNGQLDVAPDLLAPVQYATHAYLDETHIHSKEHRDAVAPTDTEFGLLEHYVCPSCSAYWEAAGETETTLAALLVCKHAGKIDVEEVPATKKADGFAAHYHCAMCGTYWESDGETVTTADALVLARLSCGHENKETRPEVLPSSEGDGIRAHEYCPDCDRYWEVGAVEETTRDSLVIVCRHEDVEHVPVVIETFFEDGKREHWICNLCERIFTEKNGEEYTGEVKDETELVLEKRELTDTADLETDEDFAKRGAVMVAFNPDGTKKAFTGKEAFNNAYKHGAAWTKAGGVVRLVCDFTMYDTVVKSGDGIFTKDAAAANAWGYGIADSAEYPAGLNIKGFWLDLGGHTLLVRSGKGLFSSGANVPYNIRNGRIIHQYTSAQTSAYSTFKHGTTSGVKYVVGPEYTFDHVEVIRLKTAFKGNTADGAMFYMNVLQSKINIIDSKLITETNTAVVNYAKGTSVPKTAAYHHEVHIYGNSVIGSVRGNSAAFSAAASCTANGFAGDGIYVYVDENANPAFLGTDILKTASEIPTGGNIETGYYSPTGNYSVEIPDSELLTATTTGVGATYKTKVTEVKQWVRYADTRNKVTFAPNGGNEGELTTLKKALEAWAANGYSGVIKVHEDLNIDDTYIANEFINSNGTFCGVDNEKQSYDPLYVVPKDASSGNLTIDLNGHSVDTEYGFLGTDSELSNFDLCIKNGSVKTSYAGPALVLQGTGGCFKLDNAELSSTADAANTILDARCGNAAMLLTKSSVSSASAAALQFFTASNAADAEGERFCYISDCDISTIDGEAQATVSTLSVNGTAIRPVSVILDDSTTIGNGKENHFFDLTNEELFWLATATVTDEADGLYTIAADPDASLLTAPEDAAAVLTVDDAKLPFAAAENALEYAAFFGGFDQIATTLTLSKDITVTESMEIGEAGRKTAFTLDLNGKSISGKALILPNGGKDTVVDITVVGELGGNAAEILLFKHVPALPYASGNHYVIDTSRYFTDYSLNLAENVSINLYTDGRYGDPDSVTYVQEGVEHFLADPGEQHDWIVDTLAAKQMSEAIDAYAVKTEDTTTYIDLVKGVSVKGYAESDPASVETNAEVAAKLKATLETMLVYGKYAEKYFAEDYGDLTSDELASIGLTAIPETDVSNLVQEEFPVPGDGYNGTSAILEDTISLKFYFAGEAFEGATANVNGNAAVVEMQGEEYVVLVPVSAKDIDAKITVTLTAADGATVLCTVSDSLEAYTARLIDTNSNAAKLAKALRAYGANAKRFSAAKAAAEA